MGLSSDFSKLSPSGKRLAITIPVVFVLLIGMLLYFINQAAVKKVEPLKQELTLQATDAAKLATEVISKLESDPSIPPDFVNVFNAMHMKDIQAAIDFEDLDMNVNFQFEAEFKESYIKGEWYYEIGRYRMDEQVAEIVMKVLQKSIEQKLKGYQHQLEYSADLVGVADAIPMKGAFTYKGKEIVKDFPYYNVNEGKNKTMSLTPYQDTLTNENLAFLRAYYAMKHLQKMENLKDSPATISVKLTDTVGDRKVMMGINIRIKDVFLEQLSPIERPVYKVFN